MKTNSFFLTSLHETDSYMMMFVYERESQAFTEPDSLCGGSFMLHALTDLGCLRLSTSLPTLLHSPLSSLFSCPLPVIACQINVPLCSHAQKLSCHIQPLLPFLSFFFFDLVPSTPPPPPPPPLVYLSSLCTHSFPFL